MAGVFPLLVVNHLIPLAPTVAVSYTRGLRAFSGASRFINYLVTATRAGSSSGWLNIWLDNIRFDSDSFSRVSGVSQSGLSQTFININHGCHFFSTSAASGEEFFMCIPKRPSNLFGPWAASEAALRLCLGFWNSLKGHKP